jgi:PrtD family type I secretion system ABC transporter
MHTQKTNNPKPLTPLAAAMAEMRTAFVVVGVFSFFLNLLILVSPLYMFQVFDRVLTSGRTETLLYLTLIAVCGIGLYGALEGVRAYMLARLSHWMERRLSREVLSASLMQANRSGLLREFMTVQNFVGSTGIAPFFDAPWVPFFLFVMWILHPWLGLLGLGAAIVLAALTVVNESATRKKFQDAQRGQGVVMTTLSQASRNTEVIAAMNMGPALSARLGRPLDEAQDGLRSAADIAGLITGTIKFVRMSVQIGVMALGAYLVIRGELTPGGMIGGSIILGRALAPIEQAIGAWRGFVGARASYGRLKEAFDATPPLEERTKLPEPKGHLSVESASFAPPGVTTPILKRVSFAANPGQVVGVVGPSAAGKSMLCRLITGVWTPQQGAVRLDGAEVSHWDRAQFAAAVGYLPQDVELFAGTVKENIARMGAADDEAVVAAAKLAGAHDMILKLQNGYDTFVGADGSALSAGQRQRVGLARALYGDPKVLVLDEPNSNLDEEGERALIGAIIQMKQRGTAIVIVAHRRTILQAVDLLLLLRDGMVENFGPRDEVLRAVQAAAQAAQAAQSGEKVTQLSRPGSGGEGGS